MTESQKLLKEADDVFRTGQYVSARDIYEKALKIARQKGDNSDITEANAMIARTYLITDDYQTGSSWLNEARKSADRMEPLGWSRYKGVEGRFLWHKKLNVEATVLFKELYEYCSNHKLYERAIDAAHMVAITGSPDEQVEWGYKGIHEAEAGNVTGWLGPLWNNLGATYEERGQYDSALAAYKKAREYHYQYGTDRNKVIADWAVGHTLVQLGKYQEANEWLQPVLLKCEEAHDDEFVGFTCKDLGEIGYAAGDYQQALDFLTRSRDMLKKAEMDQWDPDGFRKLLDRITEVEAKLK